MNRSDVLSEFVPAFEANEIEELLEDHALFVDWSASNLLERLELVCLRAPSDGGRCVAQRSSAAVRPNGGIEFPRTVLTTEVIARVYDGEVRSSPRGPARKKIVISLIESRETVAGLAGAEDVPPIVLQGTIAGELRCAVGIKWTPNDQWQYLPARVVGSNRGRPAWL